MKGIFRPNNKGFEMEKKSRAFFFGESVFTTFKTSHEEILFKERHFARLLKGVDFLYGPFDDHDQKLLLQKMDFICSVTEKNARGRLTASVYDQNLPSLTLGKISWDQIVFDLSWGKINRLESLALKTVYSPPFNFFSPSYLKSGHYLQEIIVKRQMEEKKEPLFYDEFLREGATFNFFLIKDDIILTPSIRPGVLEGVMREVIIGELENLGRQVIEKNISLEDLNKADGAFATNSIQGMIPIDLIDEKSYNLNLVMSLRKKIYERNPSLLSYM